MSPLTQMVVPPLGRLPRGPPVVPPALASVEQRPDTAGFLTRGGRLLRREAPLRHAHVEQLVVFPLPGPVDRDDDVELEVLRVVARGVPAERLLKIHVPATERAFLAEPEHPDRIRLARPLQHQHAVPLPALLA